MFIPSPSPPYADVSARYSETSGLDISGFAEEK